MRFGIPILLLAIGTLASSTASQEISTDNPMEAVRWALEKAPTGYDGITEKILERLGDESAACLIRIYEDRDLSAQDIQDALLILNLSFSGRKLALKESDQTPRAARLLLRYMEFQTEDPELKSKIQETRERILYR